MGTQSEADGGRLRWETAQHVLLAVCLLAEEAKSKFGPETVELQPFGGSDQTTLLVPRLLESASNVDEAWDWIQKGVLRTLLPGEGYATRHAGLRLPLLGLKSRKVVERFVLTNDITTAEVEAMSNLPDLETDAELALITLRGLLSYDVLRLALTKRWRVDFGVDRATTRRQMAVPFVAKDQAKDNTDFGHVDMAVVLTIIAYARSGLQNDELESVFTMLHAEPDADHRYSNMINDRVSSEISSSLASLKTISLTDAAQRAVLFDALRYRHGVIEYFLNFVVFPREVKQFEHKLVATPWDLTPSRKARSVVGFSGTNDTELLLPPTVKHRDLTELLGTNAQVLLAVVHPRNNEVKALPAQDPINRILDILAPPTTKPLTTTMPAQAPTKASPSTKTLVNVLLDVGALLLQDDADFAKSWLRRRPDCQGIVLYRNNRLEIMSCDGVGVPFALSPLANNLGSCLVLLDEMHCRGTDLRLPAGTVAALTLGRGLTRDKFVQAAMRMRALISGQHSLTFLAASEVSAVLEDRRKLAGEVAISSTTVMRWTLENTRNALCVGVAHWIAQGVFSSTTDCVWSQVAANSIVGKQCGDGGDGSDGDGVTLHDVAAHLCHKDAVSLRASYVGPRRLMAVGEVLETALRSGFVDQEVPLTILNFAVGATSKDGGRGSGRTDHPWIRVMRHKCSVLFKDAPSRLRNDLVDEEQERELETEQEEERHVARPRPATAARPLLDPAFKASATAGRALPSLLTLSQAFERYIWLDQAHRGGMILSSVWHPHVRCTTGFLATVNLDGVTPSEEGVEAEGTESVSRVDEFLRTPTCVAQIGADVVLIAPHEASWLLGAHRTATVSGDVRLRLFTRRLRDDAPDLWNLELTTSLGRRRTLNAASGTAADVPHPDTHLQHLLRTQVHLFAGSTHYPLHEQMLLCCSLGLCCSPLSRIQALARDRGLIAGDGFVDLAHRVLTSSASPELVDSVRVRESPSVPLRAFLLGPRRLGVRLVGSPIGLLLALPATHVVHIDQSIDGSALPVAGVDHGHRTTHRIVSEEAVLRMVDSQRLLSVRHVLD